MILKKSKKFPSVNSHQIKQMTGEVLVFKNIYHLQI